MRTHISQYEATYIGHACVLLLLHACVLILCPERKKKEKKEQKSIHRLTTWLLSLSRILKKVVARGKSGEDL
jgi:hypothetical protein